MLVVEDVVTRGGRVQETLDIVRDKGGVVQAVATLVDRSQGNFRPGMPLISLLEMDVETFAPEELPEDLKTIPAVKPGS